jgi:cob(I)alamin adenosyltransferase
MASKVSLLDMILQADGSELDIIDKQIATKQEELDKYQAELDKLKALRKTVNVLVNGKPERKQTVRKVKGSAAAGTHTTRDVSSSAEDRRKRIALYLAEHGAVRPQELAIQLKEELPNVMYSVTNGYFTRSEKGIMLTPEGRNKYIEG